MPESLHDISLSNPASTLDPEHVQDMQGVSAPRKAPNHPNLMLTQQIKPQL